MIERALIAIAATIALMFGGATLLDARGAMAIVRCYMWFVLVGGLTGVLFARTSPRIGAKRR